MTAVFEKNGGIISIRQEAKGQTFNMLKPGNYVLNHSDELGYYLEKIDDYIQPKKLYGDVKKMSALAVNSFVKRKEMTGVMALGDKGNGKTLLARQISIDAAHFHSMPTIIINTPFIGDQFNALMHSFRQPIVVFVDEFEKVYDVQQQQKLLTFLDGVFRSQILFVVACNNKHMLSPFLLNRPGRFRYLYEFAGMAATAIVEYCKDNLTKGLQIHIEKLVAISGMYSNFNFDMLKAIVEEMNTHDQSPDDALQYLNVKPDTDSEYFNIEVKAMNNWEAVKVYPTQYYGNPIKIQNYRLNGTLASAVENTMSPAYRGIEIRLDSSDLKSFDGRKYLFETKDGYAITLSSTATKPIDWRKLVEHPAG